MENIILTGDDGEELELFAIEETTLGGNKYILCVENEEGDSDAYILKQVSEGDSDAVYELVEDDNEFDAIAKLFEELIDDADFSY